jgi:hypothetical protein
VGAVVLVVEIVMYVIHHYLTKGKPP